tara:strand:- start:10598 stop:11272 length:675 start_codon:yes stop_codon:yes gene_type:complete
MAWKGRFSVKEEAVDVEELIEQATERPMVSRRVNTRDVPPNTIKRRNTSTNFKRDLDSLEGLAVRANNPMYMEGSIPEQALSKQLQQNINSIQGLAIRGIEPVQMAGSVPAAAADLTDDWSFKRIGLHVGSNITTSGDVTVGAGTFYLVATGSGNVTIGLPAAATCANMILSFKKIAAANNMILDANASETIDGATTKTLGDQYSWVTIISNGTNWFIISQGNP